MIEQTPSGISGLDEMLAGGLPIGRTILVMGGPGSGKTIFSVQFLMGGAYSNDENGLYLSFDEHKDHLYSEMEAFGWNLSDAESEGKFTFIDASPRRAKSGESNPQKLISMLEKEAKRSGAKRIVVDPVTSLVMQIPDVVKRRQAVAGLVEALNDLGVTSLITLELRSSGLGRSLQLEEYLAQGVIVLQTMKVGSSLTKTVQIEKMRGIDHDDQPRPYKITSRGIDVYPQESIY